MKTGIGELDRVLGGGLVPGSLVLIGGAPGIGKSTITTAALANLSAAGHNVLYVSGEESAAQVRLRAERLGPHALGVPIVADTDLEAVVATLERERPDVCVVDSVQVLYDPALTGAPGSVSQVREVAGRLMRIAKERGIATLLVGHVTKEGSLAGPRVLEHLVDCVLSFEGERERTYRTLRALKNRFGSTNEVGVFEMHERGSSRSRTPPRASSTRPPARPARSCSAPWRARGRCSWRCRRWSRRANWCRRGAWPTAWTATGSRSCSRCSARHTAFSLGSADVFVSVAGGVRVDEPGADLAIALALASAAKGIAPAAEKPLAAFGELGLTGELRHVGHADRRIAEARKFGLESVIQPTDRIRTLRQALGVLFRDAEPASQAA